MQDQQVLWPGVTFVAIEKDLELVLEFTEIETGTRKRRRPQLAAALNHTRRSGGVLLIAKLARLARFFAVDPKPTPSPSTS
nr:recombinase family protein [Deinococcus sp. 6YEL10]